MYRVGQKEVDAVARVLLSGELFRYHIGGECERFEKRYAKYVGAKHCRMTSSGTTALTAVLGGLGLGPGDEIIVPAQTYMATAISVLSVGAIPIIVDIDESLTLCPQSVDEAVGPKTRAVIPVHMWGLSCDMDGLMAVARKHDLLVIEDACQAVGGGYEGRKLGSIGHAGAFSFNYYKNMTAGEGGGTGRLGAPRGGPDGTGGRWGRWGEPTAPGHSPSNPSKKRSPSSTATSRSQRSTAQISIVSIAPASTISSPMPTRSRAASGRIIRYCLSKGISSADWWTRRRVRGSTGRLAFTAASTAANGLPWPGMTTSIGSRESISSVDRVLSRPSASPSSSSPTVSSSRRTAWRSTSRC